MHYTYICMKNKLYSRHAEGQLREALSDSPVVLLQGPRQCGKSTLAQALAQDLAYEYISFDDNDSYTLAQHDPVAFIRALSKPVVLDEVQRVPNLFLPIKRAVDTNRQPGRFLLTGSARVLQMSQIKDSLAGRMDVISLHPLSQNELEGRVPSFLDHLFQAQFQYQSLKKESTIAERILNGGYPAVLLRNINRRAAWYRNYVEALVSKDALQLTHIQSVDTLGRLLNMAALQTGQILNATNMSKQFQISRNTTLSYLLLLEKLFLIERLPAWHKSHSKRLIKAPKLHISDSGLACSLLRLNAENLYDDKTLLGHVLESFVLQELRRQASVHKQMHSFFYYREKNGPEVDIVIERDAGRVAGVEVKASATIGKADFRGLYKLQHWAGPKFICGVLFYQGTKSLCFEDKMFALPIQWLWR